MWTSAARCHSSALCMPCLCATRRYKVPFAPRYAQFIRSQSIRHELDLRLIFYIRSPQLVVFTNDAVEAAKHIYRCCLRYHSWEGGEHIHLMSLLREGNHYFADAQKTFNAPRRERHGRHTHSNWSGLISARCCRASHRLILCLFSSPLCSECVCLASSPIPFEFLLKYRMWIQERTAVCELSLCTV